MFVCVSLSIYQFKHVLYEYICLVEFRNFCLCFVYIYQFKPVFVSTNFLDDFRNVCLCFLIYQSKHVFCGYQCFGGVQECLFVLFIFLLV